MVSNKIRRRNNTRRKNTRKSKNYTNKKKHIKGYYKSFIYSLILSYSSITRLLISLSIPIRYSAFSR